MKLTKDQYTISRETLEKVIQALENNLFFYCKRDGWMESYNNEEVINAHSKLEDELADAPAEQHWYLLYGGSSEDGRGDGKYEGRTKDPAKALAHFKEVNSSPYNTGRVNIVTDSEIKLAHDESYFLAALTLNTDSK